MTIFDDLVDDNPGGIDWSAVPPPEDIAGDERLPFTPREPLTEKNYATADPDILKKKRRANGAQGYEDKVTDLVTMAVAWTAPNPATVVDAAALLIHGEAVSSSLGDLAVEDERVASVINFLSGGTGNPSIAVAAAVVPLVLQIMRNHEPALENITRISVPFTKGRIGIKVPSRIKIKLGKARILTNDPNALYRQAFLSPDAVEADVLGKLGKKGIRVSEYRPRHTSDTE